MVKLVLGLHYRCLGSHYNCFRVMKLVLGLHNVSQRSDQEEFQDDEASM